MPARNRLDPSRSGTHHIGMQEVLNNLRSLRGKRLCVMGVGHPLRADDACATVLIHRIADEISIPCVDGGVAPENHLEKVVKIAPEVVVLVDAVDFGGEPGEMRWFESSAIQGGGISTHALSLEMLCDYLTNRCSAATYLLAVQPGCLDLGEKMTESVYEAIMGLGEEMIDLFREKMESEGLPDA